MRTRGRIRLLTALLLAAALLLGLAAGLRRADEARAQGDGLRQALFDRICINMSKCARLSVKMAYAGADIQGDLFPQLKPLLYTVNELNGAYAGAFGAAQSPVDSALLKKLNDTCAVLDSLYASGRPARDSEEALCEYLRQFDDVLRAELSGAEEFTLTQR